MDVRKLQNRVSPIIKNSPAGLYPFFQVSRVAPVVFWDGISALRRAQLFPRQFGYSLANFNNLGV